MAEENVVVQKSINFAKRIVMLYKFLASEKQEYVMSKQLIRSGTSIGANIAEAECAISRKDFLSKMYIAYKECAETLYWLRLLYETDYLDKNQYNSVQYDCEELRKLLASITKTMEKNKLENRN